MSDVSDDINQAPHEWFSSSHNQQPIILGSNEIEPGDLVVYYDCFVHMDDITESDINTYGIKAGQVIRIRKSFVPTETEEYLNNDTNGPHFVVRLTNGETLIDLIYNSVRVY